VIAQPPTASVGPRTTGLHVALRVAQLLLAALVARGRTRQAPILPRG
jgi:hypothetical protein